MKKVLPKKARIVIASSLVILFLTVVVMSVVLIFSALTYSQRVGTIFTMTYKAPIPPHYPQTYVGDSLNTTLENLISSSSSSLVATGNKYTTGADDTTKECLEYTYNGQKYARLVGAVPYNSSTKFLNSSGGGTITSGANYWFKVEPIEFDTFTLSTGETVKIAKMILGTMCFGGEDWSTSAIKTYLNSTFLTESELDKVTQNRTYYSTSYSDASILADNGTQVITKIWLPSIDEIQEMYGTASTSNTAIRKVATDFARATYTYIYNTTSTSYMKDINGTSECCSTYWLRSAHLDEIDDDFDNDIWCVDEQSNILRCTMMMHTDIGFSPAFVV